MRSKLPRWLFVLVLLAGFGLVGCEDDEVIQNTQTNNRTPSAPVTFTFNKTAKLIDVPGNTAKVTISGTDANNNAVSTSNPGFPVTLSYQTPLGPVFIPVIVKHIRVQFLDSNNNLIGTGTADVNLASDVAQTVNVPFDDGLPNGTPNQNKLSGTYQMAAFGASNLGGVQPAVTLRGPVVFDGAGHVSSATLQVYSFGSAAQNAVLSGNYTVTDDGHVTLDLQAGQSSIVVTTAKLVENNGSGSFVSGTATLNGDNEAFVTLVKPATGTNNASLNGDYAVGGFIQADLDGTKFSNFFGNFVLNGNGGITSGTVVTQGVGPLPVQAGGTYSVQNDGSFSIHYVTALGDETAKGWVGTDGTLIFTLDPQGDAALVGQAFKTSTTFTAADLNGTYTLTGFRSFGGFHGNFSGQLTFDGTGNITGGFLDFNNGGGSDIHPVQANSSYSVASNRLQMNVILDDGELVRVTFDDNTPLSQASIGETFLGGSFVTKVHGSGYFNMFLGEDILL